MLHATTWESCPAELLLSAAAPEDTGKDARLLEQLKQQNRRGLERVMKRYTAYVGTILRNVTRGQTTQEDLEELTADVFLALWHHAPEMRTEHLTGYLASIARSKGYNWLRKNRPETMPIDDVVISDDTDVSAQAEQAELAGIVQEMLAQLPERKRKEATDAYSVYEEIIKDNIEYDYLIQDRYLDRDRIEEILALILETVCTKRRTIRIAGDDHPAELVKAKFMKLNSEHIRFVLDCMQENTTKIRNIKQYMKAALFNAPSTIGSYYTSLVSHDMYGGRTIQSARSKGIPDYTCNEGESL